MAKAKAKAKTAPRSAPRESVLVSSRVRAAIKDAGCLTAGDAIFGLDEWVHWLIEQAAARAKANGRKTVRHFDFMAPTSRGER